MLDGALDDYDPYASRNHAGNVARAMEEMSKSRYDRNADGTCDHPVCDGVGHVARSSPPWSEMTGIVESSFRKIGIDLDTRADDDAYSIIQRLPNNIPITSAPGWVKDYPDPFSFIGFLFDGRNIRRPANTNYSMVGLTREMARTLQIEPPARPVPSVDEEIDRCVATLAPEERTQCWADLDRYLMEEVVPWIPYLEARKLVITSDAVSPYEFDQFSGEISFAHVGIDRSL
jgi:ABC-type transport system substrate-binding protein